jgi:ferrous iron transport protein A
MEVPITELKKEQVVMIKQLAGGCNYQNKLRSMGIREGKKVRIVAIQPFSGPLVINVDNIKITVGRGMAKGIIVELLE